MLLGGNIDVLVYKKKALEFGQGKELMKYYRIICDVNDEVDELPCNEDVYNKVQPGKVNRLTWSYNTKADRNPFKFTQVGSNEEKQKN